MCKESRGKPPISQHNNKIDARTKRIREKTGIVENQTGGEKPQTPPAYNCIKRRKNYKLITSFGMR